VTRQPLTISASLSSITADWPTLLADMAAATYGSSAPTIGSATGGEKLPGGTAAMSLLADARLLLATWCHVVLDERSEHYNLGSAHLDATDVTAMARWLAPHAQWLEAHPAGLEAETELDDLAHQVRALVAPSGVRRPVIGACPIDECAGVIRGHVDERDTTDEARDLACDVDGDHRWDQSRWRLLGAMLGHIHSGEPEWMSDEDLAEWLSRRFRRSIKPNTVRQWAVRHPLSIRAHEGKYDRIAVTDWYIERQVARAG
jgi:hypothetical protein